MTSLSKIKFGYIHLSDNLYNLKIIWISMLIVVFKQQLTLSNEEVMKWDLDIGKV